MSVIINNMDMPETCGECMFAGWSNMHQTAACNLLGWNNVFEDGSKDYLISRADVCPLVEVPKHIRLIGADINHEAEG